MSTESFCYPLKGGLKFPFVLLVLTSNVKDQIPGQSQERYIINIQQLDLLRDGTGRISQVLHQLFQFQRHKQCCFSKFFLSVFSALITLLLLKKDLGFFLEVYHVFRYPETVFKSVSQCRK